jgi:hypothetical protein
VPALRYFSALLSWDNLDAELYLLGMGVTLDGVGFESIDMNAFKSTKLVLKCLKVAQKSTVKF